MQILCKQSSETLDMTSEVLGELFEGDFGDMCGEKNSTSVDGRKSGPNKHVWSGSKDLHRHKRKLVFSVKLEYQQTKNRRRHIRKVSFLQS